VRLSRTIGIWYISNANEKSKKSVDTVLVRFTHVRLLSIQRVVLIELS
jgi:hypothetical protein